MAFTRLIAQRITILPSRFLRQQCCFYSHSSHFALSPSLNHKPTKRPLLLHLQTMQFASAPPPNPDNISVKTDKPVVTPKVIKNPHKVLQKETLKIKKPEIQEEIVKENEPTTYKEKLKQAVAQYGSTVIVFHITISLISLGACYSLVASGLDMSQLFEKIGLSESSVNKLASSSGTFAAAYLIHKVFAPLRIAMTLTCAPFIVRYLRKAGFIKKALPKEQQQRKGN